MTEVEEMPNMPAMEIGSFSLGEWLKYKSVESVMGLIVAGRS